MIPSEYYHHKVEKLTFEIEKARKRLALVSTSRLICAIAFIICTSYLFQSSSITLWISSSIAVIIFLALLTYTNQLREGKEYNEELLRVNIDEIKALNSDYTAFDAGNEFINPAHPYSFDLDIFGPYSIFQILNRTSTRAGKKMLADALTNPDIEKEEITLYIAR